MIEEEEAKREGIQLKTTRLNNIIKLDIIPPP